MFDSLPVKGNAHDVLLRWEEFHHFQDVVPGFPVDFRDQPSNPLGQLGCFNLFPVGSPGNILFFSISYQVEPC